MIIRKLNYYWRLFGTFLSFSFFGLGGLVIGVTVFPLIHILPVAKAQKVGLSRRVMRRCFRLFIGFMTAMGVITWEIDGREKLAQRDDLYIVANHPSLLDVVFLISIANLPSCVVKQALWTNPFLRFVVMASNFIKNSEEPEEIVQRCATALKEGEGLIIFPEGTRTKPGKSMALRRGAAHIALEAEKNLTPVSITCQPVTLTKEHRWYNIPLDSPPHFCIKILDDIDVKPFLNNNEEGNSRNSRALTKHLENILKGEKHGQD